MKPRELARPQCIAGDRKILRVNPKFYTRPRDPGRIRNHAKWLRPWNLQRIARAASDACRSRHTWCIAAIGASVWASDTQREIRMFVKAHLAERRAQLAATVLSAVLLVASAAARPLPLPGDACRRPGTRRFPQWA